MKGEHDIQRRMEGPFQEHPGHVRRQRLVTDLVAVDSAKNDRSTWKNRGSMTQQEVERRTHDGDHCIDFSAAVLRAQMIPQLEQVGLGAESREIHLLPVHLDGVRRFGGESANEAGVENRESRQGRSLVVYEDHMPRIGKRG